MRQCPDILLGTSGAVKLSDFGLARALRRTGAETITAARGKRRYLSPEQWSDEAVSSRSDLFSLGLVLWSALIGSHPYAEQRPAAIGLDEWIRARTIANARRSVAEAAPGAPAGLQEAIEGLLQPARERIATAEQLYRMLSPLVRVDAAGRLAARLEA
ncbi:MAG: protein kinase [Sandaracinaceae bacterium]|nr:protein kinase [Sandaracinaceae bacterium]